MSKIQFSVSEEMKKELSEFAIEKGLGSASALARYATIQYYRRYAPKTPPDRRESSARDSG